MAQQPISFELLKAAIKGSRGYVKQVAHTLGCHENTVYNLMRRYSDLGAWDLLHAERGNMLDEVESRMMTLINQNSPSMVKFYLQTHGTSRGYGKQITLAGDVNVVLSEDDDDDEDNGD